MWEKIGQARLAKQEAEAPPVVKRTRVPKPLIEGVDDAVARGRLRAAAAKVDDPRPAVLSPPDDGKKPPRKFKRIEHMEKSASRQRLEDPRVSRDHRGGRTLPRGERKGSKPQLAPLDASSLGASSLGGASAKRKGPLDEADIRNWKAGWKDLDLNPKDGRLKKRAALDDDKKRRPRSRSRRPPRDDDAPRRPRDEKENPAPPRRRASKGLDPLADGPRKVLVQSRPGALR